MTKIVLFGATGLTGQRVLNQALLRGHEVVAVVRDPSKIQKVDNSLKVVKANLFNHDDLSGHIMGCDVIVSCLGTGPGFLGWYPTSFYSDGMKSIVTAMRKTDVSRLVVMTSWCTKPTSERLWFFEWILRPLFIGNLLKNMSEMEEFLISECPDIEYTVVRPSGLGNSESSGKEIKAREGQFHHEASYLMPRADVALFMLDCAENKSWIRKCVAIGI